MHWQSNSKRLVWAGLLAAMVGVLSGLPWVTSAAPRQGPASSPHLITPAEAAELIARFRATISPETVRGQFFYRSALDALLAQPAAAGIRISYAKHDDGAETFVLHATDTRGKELMELAANMAVPVPPFGATSVMEAGNLRRDSTHATGVNSHLISPEQARESIARFQASAAPGTVLSYALDRSAFDALLAQPEAHGILMHYGKHADGTNTLVLHATDTLNRDLTQLPMNPPPEGRTTRQ